MTKKPERTADEVVLMLRKKYMAGGANGPAYAFIEQVRNAAAFNASRTIDALVMSLWPSRGLELSALEVKCSRSDWLTELREPAKADAFIRYVDRFWLVAGQKDIVKEGELPPTWGLMVCDGRGVSVKVNAPKLGNPDPIDRSFLAALLRQAGREAESTPDEIITAENAGWNRAMREVERRDARDKDYNKDIAEKLRAEQDDLLKAIGVDSNFELINRIRAMHRQDPARLGKAIKAALDADRDIAHMQSRVKRLGDDAQVLADQAQRILKEHGE